MTDEEGRALRAEVSAFIDRVSPGTRAIVERMLELIDEARAANDLATLRAMLTVLERPESLRPRLRLVP